MSEREMYDRLLELAGECRHEWGEFDQSGGVRHWCKCGASWHGDFYGPRATVGDGRQMDLGEMVRLWEKLKGWDVRPIVNIEANVGGEWHVGVIGEYDEEAYGRAATPELALAAAIIAAVDGAK